MEKNSLKQKIKTPHSKKVMKRIITISLTIALILSLFTMTFKEEVHAATLSDAYVASIVKNMSTESAKEIASQVLEKTGGSVTIEEEDISSIIETSIKEKIKNINISNISDDSIEKIKTYVDKNLDSKLSDYIKSIIPKEDKDKFTTSDIKTIADEASQKAILSFNTDLTSLKNEIEELKKTVTNVNNNVENLKNIEISDVAKLNNEIIALKNNNATTATELIEKLNSSNIQLTTNMQNVEISLSNLKESINTSNSNSINDIKQEFTNTIQNLVNNINVSNDTIEMLIKNYENSNSEFYKTKEEFQNNINTINNLFEDYKNSNDTNIVEMSQNLYDSINKFSESF